MTDMAFNTMVEQTSQDQNTDRGDSLDPNYQPDSTPEDRGDVVTLESEAEIVDDGENGLIETPPEPESDPNPESDPDPDEEPEPMAASLSKVESESEPESSDTKEPIMIPKGRFDSALAKKEAEITQLRQQLANQSTAEAPAPKVNMAEGFTEMQNAILEGDSAKGAQMFQNLINATIQEAVAPLQEEIQQSTPATLEAVNYQSTLNNVYERYPELNEHHENYSDEHSGEVLALVNGYMAQGYSGTAALTKAVNMYKHNLVDATALPSQKNPESPAPTKKKPESDIEHVDVQDKATKAAAQPPDLGGQGNINADDGDDDLDINSLSNEEFDALPESTKRKLRGDVV